MQLGNLTSRLTGIWNDTEVVIDNAAYSNNRRTDFGYDADGRNTTIGTRSYSFDASGDMVQMQGQQWIVNHYKRRR